MPVGLTPILCPFVSHASPLYGDKQTQVRVEPPSVPVVLVEPPSVPFVLVVVVAVVVVVVVVVLVLVVTVVFMQVLQRTGHAAFVVSPKMAVLQNDASAPQSSESTNPLQLRAVVVVVVAVVVVVVEVVGGVAKDEEPLKEHASS